LFMNEKFGRKFAQNLLGKVVRLPDQELHEPRNTLLQVCSKTGIA
jgi:hypothetical protein